MLSNKIILIFNNEKISAEFFDTISGKSIFENLPIESVYHEWGDEIYFSTDLNLKNDRSYDKVSIGDICYWPPGKALCFFFGPTPISKNGEILPASPVFMVGKITDNIDNFRSLVKTTNKIRIEKNI